MNKYLHKVVAVKAYKNKVIGSRRKITKKKSYVTTDGFDAVFVTIAFSSISNYKNFKVQIIYKDEALNVLDVDYVYAYEKYTVKKEHPYIEFNLVNYSDEDVVVYNFFEITYAKEKLEFPMYCTTNESLLNAILDSVNNNPKVTLGKYLAAEKNNFEDYNISYRYMVRSAKDYRDDVTHSSEENLDLVKSIICYSLNSLDKKILDEEMAMTFSSSIRRINIKDEVVQKYLIYQLNFYTCRNIEFYNHDYLGGLALLSNIEYASFNTYDLKSFIYDICRFSIALGITKNGLGVENTIDYGGLLVKIIEGISNAELKLMHQDYIDSFKKNSKYFQLNNANFGGVKRPRYVPIGDYNCVDKNELYFDKTYKSFDDEGYYVYREAYSIFILKTKLISTIHAHIDMGSFIYYYDGEPIFIDAGLSKYDYCEDRIYALSTDAHNLMTSGYTVFFNEYVNDPDNRFNSNNELSLNKYFKHSDSKCRVVENQWHEGKLITDYNWIQGNPVTRTYEITNENSFTITNNSTYDGIVYSNFNLANIFTGAYIELEDYCLKVTATTHVLKLYVDDLIGFNTKSIKQFIDAESHLECTQLRICHHLKANIDKSIRIEVTNV